MNINPVDLLLSRNVCISCSLRSHFTGFYSHVRVISFIVDMPSTGQSHQWTMGKDVSTLFTCNIIFIFNVSDCIT